MALETNCYFVCIRTTNNADFKNAKKPDIARANIKAPPLFLYTNICIKKVKVPGLDKLFYIFIVFIDTIS